MFEIWSQCIYYCLIRKTAINNKAQTSDYIGMITPTSIQEKIWAINACLRNIRNLAATPYWCLGKGCGQFASTIGPIHFSCYLRPIEHIQSSVHCCSAPIGDIPAEDPIVKFVASPLPWDPVIKSTRGAIGTYVAAILVPVNNQVVSSALKGTGDIWTVFLSVNGGRS